MSDVFISYKRDDAAIARQLADALESHGCDVWWDPQIAPGHNFSRDIQRQLREARCIIVLWSKTSVASNWVRDEASEGLQREVLVPALIDDVELPLGFRQVQAADLRDWNGQREHAGFSALLASVQELVARVPVAAGDLPATGNDVRASQPKPVPARPGGPGRLFGMIITLGLLALYYLGLSANACSNRDLVVLTGGLGMVVAWFLLRSDAGYRLAWLACPCLTFLLGLPYGHRWGQMERTPLFGLESGPNCQVESVATAILAALLLAAIASDGIARWVTRPARAR